MNLNSYCVIMAGGVGNHFWPISSRRKPKQFSDILGTGKSFIRQTYERVAQFFPKDRIFIITGKEYAEITKEQIPEILSENILLEPYSKNTATCIAYATYKIHGIDPTASMITIPSDHFICNDATYLQDLRDGIEFVENNGGLLTIGIIPTRVETEYGYIQVNERDETKKTLKVKTFTEKPDENLAKVFYDSNEFLWNAGIFIWRIEDIILEFRTHMPDLHALFTTNSQLNTLKENDFIKNVYGECYNISIDVGIMEKSSNVYVLQGSFGWSNVGTWNAFHTLYEKDEQNNVYNSDKVLINDAHNCIINVPHRKNVIVQGVDDLIIAESDNYLMICHRKDEDKIKRFEKAFRLKK